MEPTIPLIQPTRASFPMELYAPIEDDLAKVSRILQSELRSDHLFVNELFGRIRGYHGKMLRPALLLLSGRAFGEIGDAHHTLAAVVELVHVATLVHDDVIDDARVRRKHPTINATNGNVAAVLLGDYLISHAYHLCSSLQDQYASRAIGATTNTVCEGELMEIHHRHDATLSERDYFRIIRGKTAALTATCCALGARYSDADDAAVEALREYGMSAGVAFQIVDDVLDLVGETALAGKDLGLDAAHGSATLPILHCIRAADSAVASQLVEFISGRKSMSRNELRSFLVETGSIDYAIDTAKRHVSRATDSLSGLNPSEARDTLTAMADFIIRRNS